MLDISGRASLRSAWSVDVRRLKRGKITSFEHGSVEKVNRGSPFRRVSSAVVTLSLSPGPQNLERTRIGFFTALAGRRLEANNRHCRIWREWTEARCESFVFGSTCLFLANCRGRGTRPVGPRLQ